MTATALLYATGAAGTGLAGQPSAWHDVARATGAPNGTWATNDNPWSPGHQRLVLTGYDPRAAILAGTGGAVPYSVDFLHVQVTFQLDAASNYDSIDVLLLDATGAPIARQPLYLLDAATGITILGWVNFTGHNGYDDQQRLSWEELAGCQLALEVTRSGAAGVDTLKVDAVGMFASYTVDPPITPAPPAGDPIEVMPPGGGVTLRVYDRAGTRLGVLPWGKLSRTVVRNALGALTADTPKGLIAPGLLDGERYLRVAVNGVESSDWYVLDDDGDDDADEGGLMRPVAIGASSAAEILDWGIVYSWQYELDPTGVTDLLNLDPFQAFAGKTPGFIMATLIDQAKARGCFPHLTYSFTADVDSAGLAWPTIYSRQYDLGTSLLKVLTTMGDTGWVDWEMTGFTLDLYVPDTALAPDRADVVLRLGKGVTQAPRKRTRKTARSVLLANGDQGATVELDDAAAEATWGRREGYEGRAGVTDLGTLTAATQVSLSRQTTASEAVTLAMDPYAMPVETPALPRPGGYVRYDQRRISPTQLEPLRVQSLAFDYGDPPKVSIELNDLWLDADVKRARQLDAILNGSTANERVPTPPGAPDTLAPAAPAGLALESTAYVGPDGTLGAQMTATWVQVTQNVDGSAIDDLLGYDIEYRQLTVMPGSHSIRTTPVTLYHWSPVIPGELIDVRIRAVDRFENPSTWSAWVTIRAGADTTPPGQPSTPLVDNFLGLLRTRWDGAFADGSGRPADIAMIEVHGSNLTGFVPVAGDPATLIGTIFAPNTASFSQPPYGVTRYVRLIAVDTTGNASLPSAQASGSTGQVVSADVFDGAIGSSKLADLAVVTAKIDNLAVNSAKVGELQVGKLTSGISTAEIVNAGRITTALSGQRVEINSLGIYAWDGAGNQFVAIDQNGAVITGGFRTATSGRRMELGLTSANTGQLLFYAPNGTSTFVSSWTESTGVEAVQFGVSGTSGSLWNRINYNTDEWANYRANRHEMHFGRGDGGGFLAVYQSNRGASSFQRFYVNESGTTAGFQFGSGAGEVKMIPGGGGLSPRLQLFTGDGFGNALRVNHGSTVAMEVIAWDASAYWPIWASAFTVQSDAASKRGIVDADLSAVSLVKSAKVRRYVRDRTDHAAERDEHGRLTGRREKGSARRNTREEIGLIAQEAPAEIVEQMSLGLGIDLYRMSALMWAALHEIVDRLVTIEGQKGQP